MGAFPGTHHGLPHFRKHGELDGTGANCRVDSETEQYHNQHIANAHAIDGTEGIGHKLIKFFER